MIMIETEPAGAILYGFVIKALKTKPCCIRFRQSNPGIATGNGSSRFVSALFVNQNVFRKKEN